MINSCVSPHLREVERWGNDDTVLFLGRRVIDRPRLDHIAFARSAWLRKFALRLRVRKSLRMWREHLKHARFLKLLGGNVFNGVQTR